MKDYLHHIKTLDDSLIAICKDFRFVMKNKFSSPLSL